MRFPRRTRSWHHSRRESAVHGIAAILIALAALPVGRAADRHPPLSPPEALKSFQLEPGLRIELVAAEPLVVDPVALAFDEQGRLFVVEGRGYPDPVEGGGKTTLGRVALLEDTDGDGRYDRRTDFATGLGYVNGLAAWRGGLFVTAAPDILYLKDTDGDGVADERRVVLTGFDATKTAQLRVSHPTLGPDGKIYVTSGLNGGKVTSPEHPDRPAVAFSLRDGRFDPDTLEFENTGGRGQFGLAFDAFGRRFICSNRHPVLQVVLEPWQLKRNPYLAFSDTIQEVSKVEAEAKVWPISRATLSADFIPSLMAKPHTGTFTSACGLIIFGGTALTPEHVGNVFICEPAQNLVQRQMFRPEGASFRTEPVEKGREFLASSDVWFRPVFLTSGPDGALYVADMYRREIDHPRYVPAESRGLLDFDGGKDRGRIYRIVRADAPGPFSRAKIDPQRWNRTIADLAAQLESPDEWWRARAHRLLLESGDATAVTRLGEIAAKGKHAEARVRALWTLQDLHRLEAGTIARSLDDPDPRVRETAVMCAGEARVGAPELLGPLLKSGQDSAPRVRFAAALALSAIDDARVVRALATIAVRDGGDRWTRAAVLSGIGNRMEAFLAALRDARAMNPDGFVLAIEDLGRIFGAGAAPEACRRFLAVAVRDEGDLAWRLPAALGLLDGYLGRAGDKRAGSGPDVFGVILRPEGQDAADVKKFLSAAAACAEDDRLATSERIRAVALLGYADFDSAAPVLGHLLDARQPPEVQLQAVRALERLGDPRGGALLVSRPDWSRYTPQIREAVLATLTSKVAFIDVLFAAIRDGTIAAGEMSSTRRAQLLKHANAKVREAAATIFNPLEAGDRMKVYQSFRAALASGGDAARGREVFLRVCSTCHTHQGTGGKVGPDLTGIRNQPAEAILLHILVPNYEVAPAYQTLVVTTSDGRSITGWLSGETENSLALRTAFGTEETVLRKNIASLTASGLSLMPDGLEQSMAREELLDVIAFLKSER